MDGRVKDECLLSLVHQEPIISRPPLAHGAWREPYGRSMPRLGTA